MLENSIIRVHSQGKGVSEPINDEILKDFLFFVLSNLE